MKTRQIGPTVRLFAGRLEIRVLFEPRDCWIGVYWDGNMRATDHATVLTREYYLCIVPLFPVRFVWITEACRTLEVANREP